MNVGYDCPECYKTFLHKQSLIRHQRTPCGKKKLQCVICLRGFISAFLLKKHQENCGNRIVCDLCNMATFTERNNMLYHQKTSCKNRGIKKYHSMLTYILTLHYRCTFFRKIEHRDVTHLWSMQPRIQNTEESAVSYENNVSSSTKAQSF